MERYSIDSFFTESLNAAGSNLPLTKPNGDATEEFLTVVGYHCKKGRKVREAGQRANTQLMKDLEGLDEGSVEYKRKEEEGMRVIYHTMAVGLVSGWSWDIKLDKKLLGKLFEENEGLALAVVAYAANAENHFKKK